MRSVRENRPDAAALLCLEPFPLRAPDGAELRGGQADKAVNPRRLNSNASGGLSFLQSVANSRRPRCGEGK